MTYRARGGEKLVRDYDHTALAGKMLEVIREAVRWMERYCHRIETYCCLRTGNDAPVSVLS